MLKNVATTAALLTAAALATGCEPVTELPCMDIEACGIAWQADPGFMPGYVDPDMHIESIGVDAGTVHVAVSHPARCVSPVAVLSVDAIGHTIPKTAMASMEVFTVGCDDVFDAPVNQGLGLGAEAPWTVSDVAIDLADVLPTGVCVGQLLLMPPATADEMMIAEARPVMLDTEVCGGEEREAPALPI